ncbi:ras-like protein [Anaeramoeba ignava]|uniref:Ras-like protein n=1 Tax=Anaeramoeba ignava TaxID=1746090 RepID=A0A9Q0RFW5_ANAIG|nr:ras-like protein [Anaeramoeba ignava]
MTEDNPLKIVLIGGGSVGKSCLTAQFLQGKFIEDYDPTIEENYRKVVNIDGEDTHLEIIDTAGQEEYRSVRDKYIKLGEGFIIVFSIISRTSFLEARNLHEAIRRVNNFQAVPVITVANKADLADERLVSQEEGETLTKKYSSSYYETSAKTGMNVNACFEEIIKQTKLFRKEKSVKPQEPSIYDEKSKGCCLIL